MKAPAKLRRGLLADVRRVFDAADEMCCSYHPDTIDARRRHVAQVRREVMALLKAVKS